MSSAIFLNSINPATGRLIGQTPLSTHEQIEQTVKKAQRAFLPWSERPLTERLQYIDRFRCLLAEKRLEIATLISTESGKPLAESLGAEIFSVLETCAWLQKNAAKILSSEPVQLNSLFFSGQKAVTIFEALGCIGIISPWNFPFSIPATSILAALSAGNSVVLKPSPRTPLTAQRLIDLLKESGIPEDVVGIIQGDRAEARCLLLSDLDRVVFTGSVAGGKAIMQLAAEQLHPVTLELGGKHPAIVLEDADLEHCADSIIWGAFCNAGQACASIERLYVVESRHDELLELLRHKTEKLRIGNPLSQSVDIGPMIDKQELKRVQQMIVKAQSQGAKLVCGARTGKEIGADLANGYFLEPTILSGVTQDMEIVSQEIFGPVLPVLKVANAEEALTLANDSKYGLGASIWSRNIRHSKALAGKIKAGMVWINDGLFSHACPDAPWGGIKYSGFGRTHGKHCLLDFVNIKFVSTAQAGRRDWNFPYSLRQSELIDAGIGAVHNKSIFSRIHSIGQLILNWLKHAT